MKLLKALFISIGIVMGAVAGFIAFAFLSLALESYLEIDYEQAKLIAFLIHAFIGLVLLVRLFIDDPDTKE